MERAILEAATRGCGKGFAHRLRAEGNIPAVVYGKGTDPKPVAVNLRGLKKILQGDAGFNTLIDLKVEADNAQLVRVSDYQFDALKRVLTHVDFQTVDEKAEVVVEVPLSFEGNCQGVKAGGVMQVMRRSLKVQCLPTQIPNKIVVDTTTLQIGELWYARDVKMPDGVTFDERYMKLPVVQIVASKRVIADDNAAEAAAPAAAAAPAEGASE